MAYIWLWLGLGAALLWGALVYEVDSWLLGKLHAMLHNEDDLLWFDEIVRNLAYYGSVLGGYFELKEKWTVSVVTIVWFFSMLWISRVLRSLRKAIRSNQGA